MSSINDQIFNILQTVKYPGDFYATGKLEIFPPHLEVAGVGCIALPLLPVQADQLISVARVAPYGKGGDTLVDTRVRRTWQIEANQVKLGGKYWSDNLNEIVSRVATGLGVAGDVRAGLYKLLVYDAGSFFIGHRDTEKAAGMFATLVIILPSIYRGGELLIKHQQEQVKINLGCDEDSSEISYAAFYADGVHEVLPVTEGCRLTLIYNLCRTDKKLPLPKMPDYRREQEQLAALLLEWRASLDEGMPLPEKMIYLLEHAYTSAELDFNALKGADLAVANVLIDAAGGADCDIHLALLSVEESGNAEYAGSGRYYDEDDFEEGEVYEHTETISQWRRPDGKPSLLPVLPFSADEFCPPDAFSEVEPDDVQFSEATGNEGASFERTYHSAALLIWPKSRYLAIINQAGIKQTLPILQVFCKQWENDHENTKAWNDAHTLAGFMMRDGIPDYLTARRASYNNPQLNGFLDCLLRIQDTALLSEFFSQLAQNGFYQGDLVTLLLKATDLLPWTEVVTSLEQAVSKSAEGQAACAAWLANLSTAKPDKAHDLAGAALQLFKLLPCDPARFPLLRPWQVNDMRVTVELVVDVLTSFSAIDPGLAEIALTYMFAWPEKYKMQDILLPAALQMSNQKGDAITHLRDIVRLYLQKRVAIELTAPANWRRDNDVGCKCQDCAQLRLFLDNPEQAVWIFKAAEQKRSHIEYAVKGCDVDCVTERRNRPYSLVCTKNQASYQRRVKLRKADLEALSRLAC